MNQLVQDKANSPVTLTNGAQATLAAEKRELAKRWFLVSPAMIIIGLAGLAPLTIILFYSFMSPGPYAGISFEPTFQAWINLVMEEDLCEINRACVGNHRANTCHWLSHGLLYCNPTVKPT